ncbi:MAG TPA: precorrin-6y C5,15-methyltransferase (decarboxylating) subunit CbiE [Actinocrinis sp.]|nr:precorrin-6y C5,15-methyltransferase (decarboxylating) subunit CbiE [Actinocrinis sp.]
MSAASDGLGPSSLEKKRARISVIGWDGAPLSASARQALDEATLVVGGARHLEALGLGATAQDAEKGDRVTVTLGPLAPALRALAEHEGPAVVLASGDPGFFGVLRALTDAGLELATVHPAVSSIATACARAGITWDDALVVSAHGSGDGRELRRAANACRAHAKVAVLTGPGAGPRELARELLHGGAASERVLLVAQRLAHAAERVESMTLQEAAARDDFAEPNVALCLDPRRRGGAKRWLAGWNGPAAEWAQEESAFEHRDGQITKAEVRALVLARLAPRVGELVWDLGAGSGSVGIECARFGAGVIAVEQDAASCGRIAANASAHDVEVAVVQGRAPGVLSGLPRPDAVFVGGGGIDVVRAALERGPARLVVALASVERVGEVVRSLEADGRVVGGVLSQSSRMAALPDGTHRFAALNPVYVVWGSAA